MWGNAVDGAYENPVLLSMYDETVKYIWVNIWCVLDLIENTNPLQGLKFDGTAWSNKELYKCTRSRTENGCYPDC